jgi:hypothetical protein
MMRNEARTGMPRVRRPGSRYVPSPFVQEPLDFQRKLHELDDETEPSDLDEESDESIDEDMDEDMEDEAEEESEDSTSASEDDESSSMPFECYGCGKEMEEYYSVIGTYARDYHYCRDCTQNGTKEEKERERCEAECEEIKRWGKRLRERFDSE